jgi:hypothetical protein
VLDRFSLVLGLDARAARAWGLCTGGSKNQIRLTKNQT